MQALKKIVLEPDEVAGRGVHKHHVTVGIQHECAVLQRVQRTAQALEVALFVAQGLAQPVGAQLQQALLIDRSTPPSKRSKRLPVFSPMSSTRTISGGSPGPAN